MVGINAGVTLIAAHRVGWPVRGRDARRRIMLEAAVTCVSKEMLETYGLDDLARCLKDPFKPYGGQLAERALSILTPFEQVMLLTCIDAAIQAAGVAGMRFELTRDDINQVLMLAASMSDTEDEVDSSAG